MVRALALALVLGAAPVTAGATAQPDLRVSGATLTAEVPRRGLAQFAVTIENEGAAAATSVQVGIGPPGVGTGAVPGTCVPRPVVCSIGSIPGGGRVEFTLAVRAQRPGTIAVSVGVSAAELDADTGDDALELAASVSPCTAFGVAGHDRLIGGRDRDHLCGRGGNDVVDGRAGPDLLDGGAGNDRITGGAGRDLIRAGSGHDLIAARDGGRDVVDCGPGRDVAAVDDGDTSRNCERVVRPRLRGR